MEHVTYTYRHTRTRSQAATQTRVRYSSAIPDASLLERTGPGGETITGDNRLVCLYFGFRRIQRKIERKIDKCLAARTTAISSILFPFFFL